MANGMKRTMLRFRAWRLRARAIRRAERARALALAAESDRFAADRLDEEAERLRRRPREPP